MEIINLSDRRVNPLWIVDDISNNSPVLIRLIDKTVSLSEADKLYIIDSMKLVSNMTDISIDALTYEIDTKTLHLSKLCTGERIFLIASLAAINKIPIWFGNCIRCLSMETLAKFFNQFGDNPYVNIMLYETYPGLQYTLERIRNGVLHG